MSDVVSAAHLRKSMKKNLYPLVEHKWQRRNSFCICTQKLHLVLCALDIYRRQHLGNQLREMAN
jgi:hypothetical protein